MSTRSDRYLKFWAASIAVYAVVLWARGKLGWQHFGLLPLALACVAPQKGARRFMLEWWPMVLFWLGYDSMRLFMDAFLPRVAVEAPFRWERMLFPSPEADIWPFYFARWRDAHRGTPAGVLSVACNIAYFSHIFGMPLILMVVWLRKRSLLFRRLVWSLAVLHVATLVIYVAYPAAPPWWVYENGMEQPTVSHSMPSGAEKGSVPKGLFNYSANKFGAIPSLHGAYPILLAVVLAAHRVRFTWIVLAALYIAAMWFACVFLNQHYIIDLVIGALLVPLSVPAARNPLDHMVLQPDS
ncbi:MAG: phosphatase PAP2 family protein [Acidobacteria bacterium]|nr:phosphatase PAP2 family protein [Acidobacteriota bacterium]